MALTDEQRANLIITYAYVLKDMEETLSSFEKRFGFRVTKETAYNLVKHLRGVELPKYFHGGKRHGFSFEEFKYFYEECHGSMDTMLKKSGYKRNSLRSLCRKCGLEPIDDVPRKQRQPVLTKYDDSVFVISR